MASNQQEEVLRGVTLDIYRFLLKNGKPAGAREIQRALNLSSPSLAAYHLQKLEDTGLVRRENGEFAVSKALLSDFVKVSRFLIPRFFFYSIFTVLALMFELIFMRPEVLTREYFFFVTVTTICACAFCFETAKTWNKDGL